MAKVSLLRSASLVVALSFLSVPLAHAQDEKKAAAEAVATDAATATAPVTADAGASPAPADAAPGLDPSKFENEEAPELHWSFEGITGTYDRASLQRGFQVYAQVCAGCHSLNKLYYRDLTALGYSEDQVKTIAAAHNVQDGPNDEGEMFERPARPSDHFVSPFPNVKAAAFANNGAAPPDMSNLAKAREGGPNYIYGILTGYEEAPEGVKLLSSQHWNRYMPGHIIAMPAPLADGAVPYEDESPQTVDQYAKDISQFLEWASEPHMEERKRVGIKVFLFMVAFAGVLYMSKRKVWKNIPH